MGFLNVGLLFEERKRLHTTTEICCVLLLSPAVICLLIGLGLSEDQLIVIQALMNKNLELKEGVLCFSHDCMFCFFCFCFVETHEIK